IDHCAKLGQESGELWLVLVVQVDLPIVWTPAGQAARIRQEVDVLEEGIEDVQPEAVHAALEPAADHGQHRLPEIRVPPVQVGLFGQEGMQIELASNLIPGPGGAAEKRGPVARLARSPEAIPHAVTPQIPIA